jgi:hypothetical protein
LSLSARRCIFCGAKADSYEHVFPDWINRVIVNDELDAEFFAVADGKIENARAYLANKAASLRAKIVCDACNKGWMSDLESVICPLLTPLILGKETTLDHPQQLLTAQWAVKTAMVGETIVYREAKFSQEDRDLVRKQGHPPLRAHVSIAAYSLEQPVATRYTRGLGGVNRNGAPFMDLYVHTIQIAHLIVSVRGTTTLPASDNRSLESIAEPRYYEIPIFPPVETCRWPPRFVMDEQTFIEYTGGHNLAAGDD